MRNIIIIIIIIIASNVWAIESLLKLMELH
jgi:hypothetical protein